eukprot:1170788-Karenia_brevis.AAC.1
MDVTLRWALGPAVKADNFGFILGGSGCINFGADRVANGARGVNRANEATGRPGCIGGKRSDRSNGQTWESR